MPVVRSDIRNVAVIAHVDHGKTSLVDQLLRQAGLARTRLGEGDFTLDSMTGNPLEREKGITILSKITAIPTQVDSQAITLNIIDTPGHADFGGEVERVLGMADGCLLIVDAAEGPMPQTRFVLQKAFELGLTPIVVINKVDRQHARPEWVLNATQDLFLELATEDAHLEFPVLYAVAREGRAGPSPDQLAPDLQPLVRAIVEHVPAPTGEVDAPLQLSVTTLDYDSHQGRIAIGRVRRGRIAPGDQVLRIGSNVDGADALPRKVVSVYTYRGLARVATPAAEMGDIVAITGLDDAAIGDTLADPAAPEALPAPAIEEPTVRMTFGVNTSPFAGREGKVSSTSRQLRARLLRELETNVSLRVQDTESADEFLVSGRGELHLAILVETLRREGYEFQVSRPEVILKHEDGRVLEPIEHLVVDTLEEHVGAASEILGKRLARLENMTHDGHGGVRMEFRVPTRGLIGVRSLLLTATRGHSSLASRLIGYEPWLGEIGGTRNGVLVASETGVVTSYAIANAQERAQTFVEPGTAVYEGMIVGLNSRPEDMAVNIVKERKQSNVRSSTAEIAVKLTPAVKLSLEQALDFIEPDELVEVTPVAFRLRKRLLSADQRAKERKRAGT